MKRITFSTVIDGAFLVAALGLALAIRLSLLSFKSIDFFNYTKVWYNAVKAYGFSAFAQNFSNYNLPYLYLLYAVVRLVPDVPAVVATKLPSLAADFVTAFYGYRIVRLRYRAFPIPALAACTLLFAPTVVLNSAVWGQADAVYACVVVATVFYTLRGKHVVAMLLLGLSLAIKAQALFVLPVVAALFLRGRIPWKHALLVPAVMLVALVPAFLAGRPVLDLLLIYPAQAGQYQQLTMHAPSALSWIPDTGRFYPYFYPASILLALGGTLAWVATLGRSRAEMTDGLVLETALISAMLVPFLLPKMHERYFYLADLFSIIFAFYQPRYYWIPVTMISISFFAYQPTLFGTEPVPIGVLAIGILCMLVLLTRHALSGLFPPGQQNGVRPGAVE